MNLTSVLLNISILYVSSTFITWFFVNYLQFSAIQSFLVFVFLNAFNGILQTYLLPFQYIEDIRKELNNYKLFGIISIGLLFGQTNIYLLYQAYGLYTALFISFGSVLFTPLLYFLWSTIKIARSKLQYT